MGSQREGQGPSAEVVTCIVVKLQESGYKGTAIALKTDHEGRDGAKGGSHHSY